MANNIQTLMLGELFAAIIAKINANFTEIESKKEDKANLKSLAYKDSLTKTDVGLGNVDNTSDINKPVSTAQQSAINSAVSALETSLKTYITNQGFAQTSYVDSEIQRIYNLVMGPDVPDSVIDSIKEIVYLLESDTSGLQALLSAINQNETDISSLKTRVNELEKTVVEPVKKSFTESGTWATNASDGTFTTSVVVDTTVNGVARIQRKIGDVYRTSDNKAVFVQVEEVNNGTNNVVKITSNSKFSGYFYVL